MREARVEPSFMKVPRYHWATCINVNERVVHGIPSKQVVFRDGDLVSVDLGVYHLGFHTDSSFSVVVGQGKGETIRFCQAGWQALNKTIAVTKTGNRIYDLSEAIETTLREAGYTPVRALVGHGVGRSLHEEPMIPGFVSQPREQTLEIQEGLVLAIEVIYSAGSGEIKVAKDGWTISTLDAKIAGLFEETVALTSRGPLVLT